MPSSSRTKATAPSREPQMEASPPRMTMETRRMDSSSTKELGSMKVVQLLNRPPARPAIIADMTQTTSLYCVTR